MTNLTFQELIDLIDVNGLTVNDRYFITDKNWTIIAIATNAYRVVVPIVTEVTKAELDALVAADELNEGLQYKVTDKNWLLVAISANELTTNDGTLKISRLDTFPDYILNIKSLFIYDNAVTGSLQAGLNFVVPADFYFNSLFVLNKNSAFLFGSLTLVDTGSEEYMMINREDLPDGLRLRLTPVSTILDFGIPSRDLTIYLTDGIEPNTAGVDFVIEVVNFGI